MRADGRCRDHCDKESGTYPMFYVYIVILRTNHAVPFYAQISHMESVLHLHKKSHTRPTRAWLDRSFICDVFRHSLRVYQRAVRCRRHL